MFYDMLMSEKLTNQGHKGTCVVYQGRAIDQYVQTSRTIDGRKIVARTHKVALLKKIQKTELADGLECSHLCHNKGCMSPDHVVAEPHEVNMSRTTCQYLRNITGKKDHCTGDHQGYPNCL